MKTIKPALISLLLTLRRVETFANEAAPVAESFIFANQLTVDADGWVQLSPFGDFPNVDAKGAKVIQRFEKADAEAIVNEFNSLLNLPSRLLGLPWYVGHPDHPRFKGQAGHTDNSAKGRIKTMEVREDGLYANVKFNSVGRRIVEDEEFHGHSVNWAAIPAGMEGATRIFRPISLKSVGFTNQPQIPVKPASLANEEYPEEVGNADDGRLTAPPKLKLIAGFKEDEDVTMEQCIEALEKARGGETKMVNEAVEARCVEAEEKLANVTTERDSILGERDGARTNFANERKARATDFVAGLVKAGKVKTADSEAAIELLANAGDAYAAKAAEFANVKPVVKTEAKTVNLGRQNTEMQADARGRQQKLESMLAKRAEEFPNETGDDRWNAVAGSPEGLALFTQMKRAGTDE